MIMTDKIKHIAAGLGIALVIALPVWLETQNLFAGLWACVSGIAAGLVKEWCDMHTEGREWDWKDFGATVIGAVIAMLFILGLHYGRG